MRAIEIPQLAELSTPEKILLVEDLWDSIVTDSDDISVPQSHKEELDQRLENHRYSKGRLLSLDELKARLDSRT